MENTTKIWNECRDCGVRRYRIKDPKLRENKDKMTHDSTARKEFENLEKAGL